MTPEELQLIRLADFASSVLAPAAQDLEASTGDARWPWSLGVLLESGALLCLGVEIKHFPYERSLTVLEHTIRRTSRLTEAGEDWNRIVGNSWAEQLGNGNLDEALAIRAFRGELTNPSRIQSHFQAALLHIGALRRHEEAARLQRALLFSDEDVWQRERDTQRVFVDTLTTQPAESRDQLWGALADGNLWMVDGMAACLSDLRIILNWAVSVLGLTLADRDFDDWLDHLGEQPRTDEDALVGSIGRILGWRLSRRDEAVRRRLGDATRITGYLEHELVRSHGVGSPWPSGFSDELARYLDRWEVMTGQLVGQQ